MHFDLDTRRARLGVGELSDFEIGPRESGDGVAGLWRAQLGSHWHRQLRAQTESTGAQARFEVPIEGEIVRHGWTITLTGRIDQLIDSESGPLLREIKTVMRPLPEAESTLRADYPGYFAQLATYLALLEKPLPAPRPQAELVFVETDGGLSQTIPLTPADQAIFLERIERVVAFLDLRLRARDRRRTLRLRAPFAQLRPGQEAVQRDLDSALRERQCALVLEAPTGFGKTGVLLEFALERLKSGLFERVIYLTGKSTGQLQVVRTLETMTAPSPEDPPEATPLATWHVRNKAEHCVNSVFHCIRDVCLYLDGAPERWKDSGLSRFYLFADQAKDMESLRSAGKAAVICPYEITRTALAFQDVWIGDYNYVFAPANRGIFYQQPGFQPERTLVLVDEAHNLPSRVADAHSHEFQAQDAADVHASLEDLRAPSSLIAAWADWAHFLAGLGPSGALPEDTEADARRLLNTLAEVSTSVALDYAAMGPAVAAFLWQSAAVVEQWQGISLPYLWWCPKAGQLALTCLDAAPAIGATLGEYGGAILATATPGPIESFSQACGLPLWPVRAHAPWRDGAYDIACDIRVDTTFRNRSQSYETTAQTVAALCRDKAPVAVFFSSYAYAEAIANELTACAPQIRSSVQPRRADLASQAAWVEQALTGSDALFLVLGSSFAEGIDLLGGRVSTAMVVGPALPEVNAVQRAKLGAHADLGREGAFERVYAIPGMQKVNQALGRLVRAPGQSARVLLHCRRFAETPYSRLLAPDYQNGVVIASDAELAGWLDRRHSSL